MGGRGSKGQIPTNARDIGNMNEAQLDKEIKKSERKIASLTKTMEKNLGRSSFDQGMADQYRLGAGGMSRSDIEKTLDRRNESSLTKARNYTNAKVSRDSEQKRLDNLNNAKKTVKGTGKTANQIASEKSSSKSSSLKWNRSTQKGSYGNKTVYTHGDYEIHSTGGTSFIYKGGKQIGMTNSLASAKSFVEMRIKK